MSQCSDIASMLTDKPHGGCFWTGGIRGLPGQLFLVVWRKKKFLKSFTLRFEERFDCGLLETAWDSAGCERSVDLSNDKDKNIRVLFGERCWDRGNITGF